MRTHKLFLFLLTSAGSFALVPDAPVSVDFKGLAIRDHNLALAAEALGDWGRAEQALLRAIGEWDRAGERYRASCAISLMNLGEVYRQQWRFPEAEKSFLRAEALSGEVAADYPQIYPRSLRRLGGMYAEWGQTGRARSLLTEAIDIFEKLKPGENAEKAAALSALGMTDLVEARYGDAQIHLHEAVGLSSAALGEDSLETAAYQTNLAMAFIQNREYGRAEPLLRRALYLTENRLGPDSPRLATILAEMSAVDCGQKKFAMAEADARRSLAVLEFWPGAKPGELALVKVNLAVVFLRQQKTADAERILPDAVAAERSIAPGTCLLADGLRELAELRSLQHAWHQAAALYRESIDIYRNRLGAGNPSIEPIMKSYASVLKRDAAHPRT